VCDVSRRYSEQGGVNKKTENFFNPDDDSENEEDPVVPTAEQTVESAASLVRLPNPLSGSTQVTEYDDEHKTSVFTNYYHKAEEAKLAVLEHHVKLTAEQLKADNKAAKRQNKKGACVSFQRGRCRFGNKCRFAHTISSESNETGADVSSEMPTSAPKFGLLPSAHMPLSIEPEDDEDAYNMQKKRKHKSGVTDTLMPPKRAMKSLDQQRQDERPWTVTQR